MRHALLLLAGLTTLIGCKPESPDLTSACPDYTRAQAVSNERAIVRLQKASGQTAESYVIFPLSEAYRSYSVSWPVCNLPTQFQRDNLSVTVSGYKLTRLGSQSASPENAPFEITDIKLRE